MSAEVLKVSVTVKKKKIKSFCKDQFKKEVNSQHSHVGKLRDISL